MKYGSGLNDIEIGDLCKDNDIKINGIHSKDKLPKELKNGWYIINLQSSNQGSGTHWLCLKYNNDDHSIFFDSMGFPSPEEIDEKLNSYSYSGRQLQDDFAKSCGWWCIACMKEIDKYHDDITGFRKFLHLFSNDTLSNEYKLHNLFVSY